MLNYEIIRRDEFYVCNGSHPKDCLMIVLSGEFICTLSDKKYNVKQNDIFIFKKHTRFKRNVISPINCIYIQFDAFPFQINEGLISIKDVMRMKNSIRYLKQAIEKQNEYLINHYTEDILIMIKPNDENSIVFECINYFNVNYEKPLTLDILIERFYISKQWLIAQFKKDTNKTPIEYLSDIRIFHGKSMLVNSDCSIGEIAEKCGFENVYYFSNKFKRHTGLSPTQYRKKFRL